MATVHLVANNGGRSAGDMFWVLVVAGASVPLLIPALQRTSYFVVWLVAGWAVAFLLSLVFAEIRAGAVRPLTAVALAPVVAIAAIHMWMRPWGPAALGGILAIAAARSWYLTFLAWWGGAMGRPTWLALSWHNQSGTLMGALGVAAAATAAALQSDSTAQVRARRAVQVTAIVIAGATLAGAWLSGSRGALVATGLGLLVVIIALARGQELRAAMPALAGVLLVTVVVAGALEGMVQSEAGQPLTTRDQTASHNMSARFGYWRAATGMALSRPLTGWGPGSYRWASVPFYPDHVTLTSSAHNEYIEILAEGGLIGALPVWLAAIAAALLAAHVVLRGPIRENSTGRRAGLLAGAAAAVVLGSHAAIDFDWDYPLLLALFATAGAVLWAESAQRSGTVAAGPRRIALAPVLIASISLLLLMGAAIAGAALVRQGDVRWDLNAPLSRAVAAVKAGDVTVAREHLAGIRAWNPGAPPLPILAAIVDHQAGEISDTSLVAAIDPRATFHSDQLLIAYRLYESGNVAAARGVVERLTPVLEARRRWGVGSHAIQVATIKLATEGMLEGCAAAVALAPSVVEWVNQFGVPPSSTGDLLRTASELTDCPPLSSSSS